MYNTYKLVNLQPLQVCLVSLASDHQVRFIDKLTWVTSVADAILVRPYDSGEPMNLPSL